MIYSSADFQCPDTGVPVVFIYNEDTYLITAEICTFLYSLDEANDIAEKYDCWF